MLLASDPSRGAGARCRRGATMRDVLVATYRIHDLTGVDLAPDGGALTWTERFRDPRDPLHSMLYSALYVSAATAAIAGGLAPEISTGSL